MRALSEEYERSGVGFAQRVAAQAWGGTDFHVRDVECNVIPLVEFPLPAPLPRGADERHAGG